VFGFFQCSPSRCGRLKVTGDPVPDCTGEYVEAGTWSGRPYYNRVAGTYIIWWYPAGTGWWLSNAKGAPTYGWFILDGSMLGTYTPVAPAAGNPIVENA